VSALQRRLSTILEETIRDNRLRTLDALETAQGRQIKVNGLPFINFSSNDYLGLSAHPDLSRAASRAAETYGVGSGASALLSGRSTIHDELEKRLASFLQRDRALLFSSGYMANIGVINALVSRNDHIFSDELNHASLIDAIGLSKATYTRYPHADTRVLSEALRNSDNEHKWIVTDTLFSMDGDVAPLRKIAKLAELHKAILIGDDAHGFGVLSAGRGAGAACNLTADEMPIQVVTFGKALGTAGAAVVGSEALINAIVQRGRTFIYDTAPPPMIAAATIAALDIVENDAAVHQQLSSNIARFRAGCEHLPLRESDTPIQPVIVGRASDALKIAEELRRSGFYVRAIRPPTVPEGTARLRICLSAAHLPEDIDTFVTALKRAFAGISK
jgi:8-amino-7-oxononanoate synthase